MLVRFDGGHGVRAIRATKDAEPVSVGEVVDLPRRTVRELRSRGYRFESVDDEQIPEIGGVGVDARAPSGRPETASGSSRQRSRAGRNQADTASQETESKAGTDEAEGSEQGNSSS